MQWVAPEGQSSLVTSLQWWPKVDDCTRVLEESKHIGIVYLSCTAHNYPLTPTISGSGMVSVECESFVSIFCEFQFALGPMKNF